METVSENVLFETEVLCKGKYVTVVQAKKGDIISEGIARRSSHDKYNEDLGISIAKGRAVRGLLEKLTKVKKVNRFARERKGKRSQELFIA